MGRNQGSIQGIEVVSNRNTELYTGDNEKSNRKIKSCIYIGDNETSNDAAYMNRCTLYIPIVGTPL